MNYPKKNIVILSSSVRKGRNSHRLSLHFAQHLKENFGAEVEIIDLSELHFPLFEERLSLQENPLPSAVAFGEQIRKADGVVIVTPEYNGGYPAALKNAIDLLVGEWHRKPVAIATVSDGPFAGTQVIMPLQFSLWKLRAHTVAARYHVPMVQNEFDVNGAPSNSEAANKRTHSFLKELYHTIAAWESIKTQ